MYIWLVCRMYKGRVFCRPMKNVAVVEGGIKLGDDKGSDLFYSDNSLEGGCDDNLEGVSVWNIIG